MKRAIQLLLALAVSGFFIWWSLRNTNIEEVWATILRADLKRVALYVGVLVIIHFLRTLRWGLLLEPLAKPKFSELNPLSAVGVAALMMLPFRLGELARPLLAAEYLKVSRSAAMASIVVERVVDGVVMALLLVALLWSIPAEQAVGPVEYYRRGGAAIALFWALGLAALVFAVWKPDLFVKLLRATVGRISPKVAEKVEEKLSSFINGLRVLPSVGKAASFFALTAAYWLINGYGLSLLGPAFGLEFTLKQAYTVLGMQVIGAMIPAGPGMIGTFQAFTQLGVGFFFKGIDAQSAAFANTVWFLQFTQQALFGRWFILGGRVKPGAVLGGLTGRSKEKQEAAPDIEPMPALSIEK